MTASNALPRPDTVPVRQTAIDYMKAFLVIGMVLAHALQLLSKPRGLAWLFSVGINLITFSGFFFCFGYVFYVVYLTKPAAQVRGRMLKTTGKTLFAYYIVAFASSLLLQHLTDQVYTVSPTSLFRLITLAHIPWYSEFLLSFCLITLLIILFFCPVRWLLSRPLLLTGVVAVCLLTAVLLPRDLKLPNALGLLIGTRNPSVFPLVPYLPIFLAGAYFARHRIIWHRIAAGLSLTGTGSFVIYYFTKGTMPAEFSPSVFWLVGPYGILYAYFLFAHWLERSGIYSPPLLSIGRNTLFYLIISSIVLFALSRYLVLTPGAALGTGVLLLLSINFLISLVNPPPRVPEKSRDVVATEHSL